MSSAQEEKIDFYRFYKIAQESEEARIYVLSKELYRPKTNWKNILCIVVLHLIICIVIMVTINKYFNTTIPNFILGLIIWLVTFALISKYFCIKLVECYQHYAKEETRRRCSCKPTCSEYSILVLKKYCLIVALIKIRKRLFHTCNGEYKIDFP